MMRYIGYLLIGAMLSTILLLTGCSGSGGRSYSSVVYGSYYDPYPGWGHRTVYNDYRPRPPHHRPPPGYRPPPGRPASSRVPASSGAQAATGRQTAGYGPSTGGQAAGHWPSTGGQTARSQATATDAQAVAQTDATEQIKRTVAGR